MNSEARHEWNNYDENNQMLPVPMLEDRYTVNDAALRTGRTREEKRVAAHKHNTDACLRGPTGGLTPRRE